MYIYIESSLTKYFILRTEMSTAFPYFFIIFKFINHFTIVFTITRFLFFIFEFTLSILFVSPFWLCGFKQSFNVVIVEGVFRYVYKKLSIFSYINSVFVSSQIEKFYKLAFSVLTVYSVDPLDAGW